MRLVSCVPSLSELVYYLRPDALVGRTKFCVFPEELKTIPTIGGTKTLDIEKIKELQPDFILATKEENIQEQIEALNDDFPVKLFDIQNFEHAVKAIGEIGLLMGCSGRANEFLQEIQSAADRFLFHTPKRAIYLIWKNPWMSVGGDTFINSMMEKAGFQNVFKSRIRYPEIDLDDAIQSTKPEVVLFSSEPYPFKESDLEFWRSKHPQTRFIWVDGTYFSWYGVRMKNSFSYFEKIYETQFA